MKAKIRKIATFVEEVSEEMGRKVEPPTRRAAAVAVIENPFAGQYVEDLSELMTIGEELGELLTQRAVAALGIAGPSAESYGKAAAVGENGEIEHAAAILHPKLGTPVRRVLGKGAALIPSSKKRGGLGVVLDGVGQAMVDVVVDQGLLGRGDGAFDGVELLDDVHAGTVGLHHADDVAQVPLGALEPLDDVRVGRMDDVSHEA